MTQYRLDKMIVKLRQEAPVLHPQIKAAVMEYAQANGFKRRAIFDWRYAAGFAVLVLFSAGGTVFAAQGALPGNVLYPVKRVSENAYAGVQVVPQAKVAVKEQIIQRRFDEAELVADHDDDAQNKGGAWLSDEALFASDAWINEQEHQFNDEVIRMFDRDMREIMNDERDFNKIPTPSRRGR